jgi:hypothetical protein
VAALRALDRHFNPTVTGPARGVVGARP